MYPVDFFKRMTSKSNIPVLIYLVLNVFVIGAIMNMLFGGNFAVCLLGGIVLYAISLVIALSPFGEFILRLQTGCKKIKRVEQINYIEPIFREVYDKAKKLDPSIPDDVQLFMNSDEDPNAFATGRKTICITEGMLNMPGDQIKATLGHEFEADEFSFNLGYGNELCILLDSISGSHAKGLLANLASSHPDKDDRIAKLQELGATYRATYGAK